MSVEKKIKNALATATVWDKGERDSVTGLHLRRATNSWMLYYRTRDNTQRRPKIGKYPQDSLSEVRKRARALVSEVAMGNDPKGEWDMQKSEMTLHELFKFALDHHWSEQRYVDSGYRGQAERLWLKYALNTFGNVKPCNLTVGDVRRWHAGISSNTVANRVLAVLSQVLTTAERYELAPVGSNICKAVKPAKESKRERFATPEEVAAVWAILRRDEQSYRHEVCYLRLLILTGARPSVIQRATWGDIVEINGRKAIRHKAKSGKIEHLVLPQIAVDAIEALRDNEYKGFMRADLPIIGFSPRGYWQKVRNEIGSPDLWMRDWRRTFGVLALGEGFSLDAIGEVFTHASTQTTKRYATLMTGRKAEVVDRVSDVIAGVK